MHKHSCFYPSPQLRQYKEYQQSRGKSKYFRREAAEQLESRFQLRPSSMGIKPRLLHGPKLPDSTLIGYNSRIGGLLWGFGFEQRFLACIIDEGHVREV